jgi:hypothetical protein
MFHIRKNAKLTNINKKKNQLYKNYVIIKFKPNIYLQNKRRSKSENKFPISKII